MPKTDKQFFIENKGQWPLDVLFLLRKGGNNVWITNDGLVSDYYKIEVNEQKLENKRSDQFKLKPDLVKRSGHVIKMKFSGCNPSIEAIGNQKSNGYYNYFLGNDQTKWATNVGLFKESLINNMYDKIDVRYYFEEGNLRYDFIVRQGGETKNIELEFEGTDHLYIDRIGELVYSTSFGEVKQGKLRAYQNVNSKEVIVESKFVMGKSGKVHVEIGTYNKDLPLIIDPLVYSTFIGEPAFDQAFDMVIDANEDAYLTGMTCSDLFPTTVGSYNWNNFNLGVANPPIANGWRDIFVTKITPTGLGLGIGLVYSTFIGGTDNDWGESIALDAAHNVYIAGGTYSGGGIATSYPTWPQTTGIGLPPLPFQPFYIGVPGSASGTRNAIVTKLNPAGTNLVYSTFLGGNGEDYALGIVVNPTNEHAFVTGMAEAGFPTGPTIGPLTVFQPVCNGSLDVFVVQLDFDGANEVYSTFIGGNMGDVGYDIALDNLGNSYITGATGSTMGQPIPYPHNIGTFNSFSDDVFITKLNSNGTALDYSTVIGTLDLDRSQSIVVGLPPAYNAYITGYTYSQDFPHDISTPGFAGGGEDAFVTQIDGNGNLVHSLYLGGNNFDEAHAITLNPVNQNVYVTGTTASANFPNQHPEGPTITFNSFLSHIFFVILNPNLGFPPLYSTVMGGSNFEIGFAIQVDNDQSVYVAGMSGSWDYPTFPTGPVGQLPFDNTNALGISDVILTKLCTEPPFVPAITSNSPVCSGGTLNLSTPSVVGSMYSWTGPNSFSSTIHNPSITNVTTLQTGVYTVVVTDAAGCTGDNTVSVMTGWNASITSPTICLLTTGTLLTALPQNTVSTPYLYQWSLPVGATSATLIGQQLLANAPGIYTVTVTDYNNCSHTATFQVFGGPTFSISAQQVSTICIDNPQITLTVTPMTGPLPFAYVWSPAVALSTSNTINPVTTTNLSANQIYTVTVTDANGCSSTGTINAQPTLGSSKYCCSQEGTGVALDPLTLILNSTNVITSIPGGSVAGVFPIMKRVYINGTFVVDQDMTFDYCHIYFTENSKIVLTSNITNPNVTLTLNNCTLQTPGGCPMWEGIYADNSMEQVFINNSTLMDMMTGVNISNNARLSSTNSWYHDNYAGIQLKNNTVTTSCIVTNNEFKKQNVLKPPYASEVKPRFGIKIINCNDLNIGAPLNVASTNTFEKVWTGIYIEAIPSALVPSNIYLNHNRFYDIKSNTWGSTMNTDSRGWGVYATASKLLKSNGYLYVMETPSATTLNFEDCDKGILLQRTSCLIYNQKMDKTVVGVSMIEGAGKSFKVNSNSILNTELGISKVGDESSSGFYAYNNRITLSNPIPPALLNLTAPAVPTGIYSAYSSLIHDGVSKIYGNLSISSPLPDKGVGISLANGMRDFICNNNIHFTANTSTATSIGIPEMVGIYTNKSQGTWIQSNIIDNNFSVSGNIAYVPGNNAGIYVNENLNAVIRCNTINYNMYGIFALGKNGNSTWPTYVAGNFMRAFLADFMLWPLVNEGSLGQVGKIFSPLDNYNDNNTYLVSSAPLNNVFRVTACPGTASFIDQLVTTLTQLAQTQSSALGGATCKVEVQNPSSFTQTFDCNSLLPQEEGTGMGNIDFNLSLLVAQDQIDFEDYDEGARRDYEEMIYEWLSKNDSIRLSSPILDSFYLNRYSGIVGNLNRLDNEIAMLSDSTLMADSAAWNSQWQLAMLHNEALGTGQVFEANAKWINGLYLLSLKEGIDSLTGDLEGIELLANTCPYLGGNAVYRARALFGMFNSGIHYDDLVLCNGQGVYKNGVSKLQSQLNQLNDTKKFHQFETNDVILYPNPASTHVDVLYSLGANEEAHIRILDMFGNTLKVIRIEKNTNRTTIDVKEFANGIYMYEFKKSSGKNYFGKLIIE